MRLRRPDELNRIAAAALAVFTRAGYALTQVKDVAEVLGISVGNIYQYVEDKNALFELAVLSALGIRLRVEETFYRGVGREALLRLLSRQADELTRWPVLRAAASRRGPVSREELQSVLNEICDVARAHRHAIWLFDRCAPELPEIADLYERRIRKRLFSHFARFFSRLVGDAAARPSRARELASRALLESTIWLAAHSERDPLVSRVRPKDAEEALAIVAKLLAAPNR